MKHYRDFILSSSRLGQERNFNSIISSLVSNYQWLKSRPHDSGREACLIEACVLGFINLWVRWRVVIWSHTPREQRISSISSIGAATALGGALLSGRGYEKRWPTSRAANNSITTEPALNRRHSFARMTLLRVRRYKGLRRSQNLARRHISFFATGHYGIAGEYRQPPWGQRLCLRDPNPHSDL
jgi:hypothetical protein